MNSTHEKSEILSVSAYLDQVNYALKNERSKILGEVCNMQMYEGRSYLYFSIKDSKDQSTIKCFMWKNDFKISGVALRDGLEVVVTAYPSIYKPNGGLSLQVEHVELVGEGALQLVYEQLKKKLDAEGLFAATRKRLLPEYPHRIGVITSKSGAVINDFLSNIGKFGYEILFVDSKVEGGDATKDLLAAVTTLRTKDIDVLVVMRGGGSLESFLAFNNETLVRAIADFPVPVLTGIGHDKDVSLVALVSDKNVSTPTAVTHVLNTTWTQELAQIKLSEQKIIAEYEFRLKDVRFDIENSYVTIEGKFAEVLALFAKAESTLQNGLFRIETRIARLFEICDTRTSEILRLYVEMQRRVSEYIEQSRKTIEIGSPERQLSRGYSIVKRAGKVIRSIQDVQSQETIEIVVSDGTIKSTVI